MNFNVLKLTHIYDDDNNNGDNMFIIVILLFSY